jgi:N-acetylglutamate synthase-like GNAT family acetyltransferase
MSSLTISDLRQCPEFFDTVADRIWQAWWKADGYPPDYISTRLRENMSDAPIPFALVAHEGNRFLGTGSVIASDLPERPQLTPWVACVWVEAETRSAGVGSALVERATQDCFALGVGRVYLCARAAMTPFYQRLGWTLSERDVGPRRLGVFLRDAGKAGALSSQP